MKLTKEQINRFDGEGYLFFSNLFSQQEIKYLIDAVPKLYERREEYNFP